MEVIFGNVLGEDFHLFDADRAGFGRKFDPDGADCGAWVWGGGSGEGGVFLEHGGGGARGEGHFFTAAIGFIGDKLEIEEDNVW